MSSNDVVLKASGLQKDIDDVSLTANQLTASFYALLAWMLLVTVALLAVVVIGWRRWRRRQRQRCDVDDDDDDDDDDADSCRSVDDAPVSGGGSVSAPPTAAAAADTTTLEGVEIGRRSSSSSPLRSDSSTVHSRASSTPTALP